MSMSTEIKKNPTLQRTPSEAELALQSLKTDMESHDEMSTRQLDVLKQKLEETERIHMEQLNSMNQRHRMELELAAIGSTVNAMIPAITETIATTTNNTVTGKQEEGVVGVNEAMMTTRRAMLDLNQEAEIYARPSPERKSSPTAINKNNDNVEKNVIQEMKELADVVKREHKAEIEKLKREHSEQLKAAMDASGARVDEGSGKSFPSSNDAEVLALKRQVAMLTSRLEDAREIAADASVDIKSNNQLDPPNQLNSSNPDNRDVARAAVLRPIVRGLHLQGLERGFHALNTERLRHLALEVEAKKRDQAGFALHCVAKRGVRPPSPPIMF
jgi:hypothetical protein